ncbi:MAG: primosomal protein N' [Candidatus Bipolaricaulota bacterium]|nr:primosomal protein N' [Candidatus Bipolaricaulota bacterium]
MILSVALPIPVESSFDFVLRDDLPPEAVVGHRVRVRLSGKEMWGVAVAVRAEASEAESLEPILEVAPPPAYPPDVLGFCAAICRDTCAPLGILLNRTLPRVTRRAPAPRRIALAASLPDVLSYIERMQRRAPRQVAALRHLLAVDGPLPEAELGLPHASVDRLIAGGLLIMEVSHAPRAGGAWPASWPRRGQVLLQGEDRVTEYGRLLDGVIAEGRQALVLVPEILLAHRIHRRLSLHRPGGVLYHSGLAEGTRGTTWERVADGSVPWVVSTRSGVFLPFRDLALVIVDEEQDPSHKQSDMLPYFHARRAAEIRMADGLVVLGSAAPSVETARAVDRGTIARMPSDTPPRLRAWEFLVPESPTRLLSTDLLDDVAKTLASGRRVVVGVPRRGYFPAVVCRACRRPVRCDACGTNLTVGERGHGAACPVCGRVPAPLRCGHCASTDIAFVGFGTLRIEEELKVRFAEARILRIDADVGAARKLNDDLLVRLEDTADIVLGTAMLVKGPPLTRVGLVLVLDVDRRLAVPDFRARERTFQYLANVAALGGEARVVVVTQAPDRSVFRYLRSSDYDGFVHSELADREAFSYPPFAYLARVVVTRADRGRREADILRVRQELAASPVRVLGPTQDTKDARRAVFLLKAESRGLILDACRRLLGTDLPVQVDVDPERL